MKTNWTKPGTGATADELRELIRVAWAPIAKKYWDDAYAHLNTLRGKTRLAISATGAVEEYDLRRIAAI